MLRNLLLHICWNEFGCMVHKEATDNVSIYIRSRICNKHKYCIVANSASELVWLKQLLEELEAIMTGKPTA